MIIFISYSAHFAGVRAESREANCCGGRLLHFDFYIFIYSCCSCTQMRSMKLLFGSQNSRSLNITNFRFLKGVNLVFKNHTATMVSSKCQNEARTLPSVVVRTSFKIFRTLFDVRPRMRRLSQALQIECIKHELTVQMIFLSEMGVNKVRDQRNRRDNYLVSEIVSQLCNN